MKEFEGRFTKLSFFASSLLSSTDLFTQASVSLISMFVMSFVSSLSGPLSVFVLTVFFLWAALRGLGESEGRRVPAPDRFCLVNRICCVFWFDISGVREALPWTIGLGYCCVSQLVFGRG